MSHYKYIFKIHYKQKGTNRVFTDTKTIYAPTLVEAKQILKDEFDIVFNPVSMTVERQNP